MRKMKDSGIDWIGAIPEDWNECRLRFLCTIQTGNMDTQNRVPDGEYPFYVRSPIVERSNNYTFDGEAVLMAGDGVGAGKVFHYVTGKYACHQRVYSLSNFNKISAKYLFYYLSENFWRKIEESNAKSTVDSVRLPMLKEFVVVYPNMDTQLSIVNYLDEKCARLDEIVARQHEVIGKLNAYKQSIISETVLNGLNPNAETKNSGYDFIGNIPAHWKVCRLRNIGTAQNGISKGGEFFGKGFPFVSYGDVYKNYSLPTEVSGLIESTDEERERYSVEKGDIFFTRTSETLEEVGIASVCEETIPDATFAGFLIRVRPFTDELYVGYSKYFFRSNHQRFYLVKEMNLVTRASLGQDLLKSMPVLIPPMEEQKQIADYLDKKCAAIDSSIAKRQQLIDKLTEYKKSLIFEVVTGKKEV